MKIRWGWLVFWIVTLGLCFYVEGCIVSKIARAEDEITLNPEDAEYYSDEDFSLRLIEVAPFSQITIFGEDNKQVIINFGGEGVTYSGDLPVDEAARVFFDHTFKVYKEYYKCPNCGYDLTTKETV